MIVYQASNRTMPSPRRNSASSGKTTSSKAPSTASTSNAVPSPRPRSQRTSSFQNNRESTSDITSKQNPKTDAFDTSESANHDNDDVVDNSRTSVDLDDLPIELITLTDSFVESLSAKVHATPPNIDKLSLLFQDFYTLASSHINTHISALATKHSRDASPAPSSSSISSAASRFRSKAASIGSKDKPKSDTEQQMITADELAERKKARRALEAKKGLLEEAVERRLCEAIYHRIYRHRSTQDEAQDDKLRSKTAALALVDIGPSDLGVDTGVQVEGEGQEVALAARNKEIRDWLEPARKDLMEMSESHYPLGKLNYLKDSHKSIVDTLAHFQPSASADEIMPMLIYTLITLSPQSLNAISDLHFMQYFRWEPKLTGEAAYCLTNLEAAISFLETVDLTTLRADEQASGPPKASTPQSETFPPAYAPTISSSQDTSAETSSEIATASEPAPSPGGLKAASVLRNRRLSDLVNTPAQAFGAASDAVFSTADQGLKTISNSLGESYSFLVGKLRERQNGPKDATITVPRTLDDARKLISTPPPEIDDDAVSATSSAAATDDADQPHSRRSQQGGGGGGVDDRVLTLIGGKREHSADSARSGLSATSSSKKVAFAQDSSSKPSPAQQQQQQQPAMLDSVRNLGSSLNPMARLPSMNMIRGFGRNMAAPSTPAPNTNNTINTPVVAKDAPTASTEDGGDLSSVCKTLTLQMFGCPFAN